MEEQSGSSKSNQGHGREIRVIEEQSESSKSNQSHGRAIRVMEEQSESWKSNQGHGRAIRVSSVRGMVRATLRLRVEVSVRIGAFVGIQVLRLLSLDGAG